MESLNRHVLATLELVANPQNPMAIDLRIGCEPPQAAVTRQEWPASSFRDRERERIRRG